MGTEPSPNPPRDSRPANGAARCVAVAWDGSPAAADAEALAALVAAPFGLPVVRLRVDGGDDIVERLVEQVGECAAAYLAVGPTHRGSFGRIAPGSTAVKLVRHGVAVLSPPRGYAREHPDELRIVVAGYDGTARAEVAVARAADLADHAGGTLRIRAAAQAGLTANDPVGGPHGVARLRELVEGLPHAIRPDGQVVRGEATQTLLAEIDRGADIIFVGSHRYGPLLHALMGSVSDGVSERGTVPVAIVPEGIPA